MASVRLKTFSLVKMPGRCGSTVPATVRALPRRIILRPAFKASLAQIPFGNSQTDVPKGQLKIAQRFKAGATTTPGQDPKERLKEGAGGYVQSSLRDSNWIDGVPGVETPG